MAAVKHVQNRGADVLHQFQLERSAVVIFRTGGDVPEPDVFAARPDTAPAPAMIHTEIGTVFVFVLVLAGVNAVGPQRNLLRRALHTDGGTARNLHQPVARAVHAHPVEDGSGVNVVPAFAQTEGAVHAAMLIHRRNIKTG